MSGLNIIAFRGRRSSFESLIDPHFVALYRLAFRLTGDQAEAEDLVQELIVRLYPKFSELKKIESLRPWLARSLYNLFIDTRRSNNRSPLGHSVDESHAVIALSPNRDDGPEASVEHHLQAEHIQAALDRLSETHRSLVIFHDVEGYTLPELAEILQVPLGTLKSRLHRARAQLRALLGMQPLAGVHRVNE